MIGWIVKLLTGGTAAGTFGPWLLLGAVVAIGGAGAAVGSYGRGLLDAPALARQERLTAQAETRTATERTATQACIATHEKYRADQVEKGIAALATGAAAVNAAAGRLAQQDAARRKNTDDFNKELANAPVTKTCSGSAAELAYRRSVVGLREGSGVSAPAGAP